MKLDEQAILSLCRMRDPVGIVSVYAGTTPDRQVHERPEWMLAIRNELNELRTRAKEEGPRERWVAVHKRLDGLEEELERILDPSQPGRGKAIFAPVSDDSTEVIALQLAFDDAVYLEEAPYVRPLVGALDHGRPAGVAVVDRSGVRLIEWSFGTADLVSEYDFSEPTMEWRELGGPAADNPARAQQSSVQRDLFEERLKDHVIKFMKNLGAEAMQKHIVQRGWDRVVVAGEGRLAGPFVDGFPTTQSIEILRIDQELRHLAPHEIAETVEPMLSEAQQRHEAELVEMIKERALGGGHGTLGLSDTLSALAEGRIQHLVYDDTQDYSGFRTQDGVLVADAESATVAKADLIAESQLAERMIERALETSARVTPLEGEAAEALAPHDGVGAICRW